MRKWFGDSPCCTPSYYGFQWASMSEENHLPQFEAVRNRLFELAKAGEVSLIYCDDEGPASFVIAYRFTSDAAHYRYRDELTGMASSIGRGVWDVFSSDVGASYSYRTWFERNVWAREAAAEGVSIDEIEIRYLRKIEAEKLKKAERERDLEETLRLRRERARLELLDSCAGEEREIELERERIMERDRIEEEEREEDLSRDRHGYGEQI